MDYVEHEEEIKAAEAKKIADEAKAKADAKAAEDAEKLRLDQEKAALEKELAKQQAKEDLLKPKPTPEEPKTPETDDHQQVEPKDDPKPDQEDKKDEEVIPEPKEEIIDTRFAADPILDKFLNNLSIIAFFISFEIMQFFKENVLGLFHWALIFNQITNRPNLVILEMN